MGEVIKMVTAALLNEAGVYLEMVTIAENDLTELHIPMTDCDLPPNKYRWDFTSKHFVPLPKNNPESAVETISTLKAIALGFIAIKNSGISLPKETLDWLASYSTTFDFKA